VEKVTDKLYNILLYRVHLDSNSQLIGTDCIGSCKSNYHTIATSVRIQVNYSRQDISICLLYYSNKLRATPNRLQRFSIFYLKWRKDRNILDICLVGRTCQFWLLLEIVIDSPNQKCNIHFIYLSLIFIRFQDCRILTAQIYRNSPV
jgi:hypothetical protein